MRVRIYRHCMVGYGENRVENNAVDSESMEERRMENVRHNEGRLRMMCQGWRMMSNVPQRA